MRREFVEESIEHYREIINDYNEIIAENEKKLADPNTNQVQREVFEALNDACKKERKRCQKAIERLLNE